MRRDLTQGFSELSAAALTYRETGATRAETLPHGYGHVNRDADLGAGLEVFERAVAALFDWRMHERLAFPLSTPAADPRRGLSLS